MADFDLTLNVTETGEYGNKFNGTTDADGVVTAGFIGTDADVVLSFSAYDVDYDDEIEILLNGVSLGFLPTGLNDGFTPQIFTIPAADQTAGENVISFVQARNVTFKWGVTDILVAGDGDPLPPPTDITLALGVTETGEYGNKFNGTTDADGVVTAGFIGQAADVELTFNAYDVDYDDEIEILLNGVSIGFLPTGLNNDFTPQSFTILAADQNEGVENVISFVQARDVNFKWGVTDILIEDSSAPPPPTPTDITLTLGVTETGEYGNKFNGTTDADGVVTAGFTGQATDVRLTFDAYDVDYDDEIEILLNGVSLGFLPTGLNNDFTPQSFTILAADQNEGVENVISFVQARDVNFKWGVTDILIEDSSAPPPPTPTDITLTLGVTETGEYGNKFNGTTDADGVVTAGFTGQATDVRLTFDAYDVDYDDEIEILLNGVSLGFLPTGLNNDFTPQSFTILAADQNEGVENVISFVQARDVNFKWGVTDILIEDSSAPPPPPPPADITLTLGVTETGEYGNKFNGNNDADGVVTAGFIGQATDVVLTFNAYDVDYADELEVLINGTSLGFLPVGVNDGETPQSFTILASQQVEGLENVITFQLGPYPLHFKWGVTDILIEGPDLTVDTAEISGISTDSGASASDGVTNDAMPIVSGLADALSTVALFDGTSTSSIGTTTADGAGNWSIALTSPLAEGVHALTAEVTDPSLNVATSVVFNVTIDTAAPNAPVVTGVLDSLGAVAVGGVTDDGTPTIKGTAEAGAAVEVFVDGISIGTTMADQTTGFWWVIGTALTNDVYTVTAEAVDLAGNASPLSSGFVMEVNAVPDPVGYRYTPDDPLYVDQWHLAKLGDIERIWAEYDGSGVSVGIYDNGVEHVHPDLNDNYDGTKHVTVGGVVLDPAPSGIVTAEHGTAVGGVIAAEDNSEGGVGVAFGASITGVNIFGGPADINGTDVTGYGEAIDQAWTFDIINNSWGALPDFNNEVGLDASAEKSLLGFTKAVEDGRSGLGTIILKAAGNSYDGAQGDFLNTLRYTIVVGAHDLEGDASWYSNRGANLLVSAPSSGSSADSGIVTSDLQGADGYAPGDDTTQFGGTSSATPVVAGVVALMLEANPDLGWRDVQSILAYSAHFLGGDPTALDSVPTDTNGDGTPDDFVDLPVEYFEWFYNGDTHSNGGGLHFSEDYGFGGVDAYAAVRMAEVWSLFGAAQTSTNEITVNTAPQTPGLDVNQGSNSNAFVVASFDYLPGMEDIDLEYVEVFIQYHAPVGEISLDLISPSGTEVSLLHAVDGNVTGPEAWKTTNSFITDPIFAGFLGTVSWTYGVNSFLGEDVYGEWQIVMTEVSPNNADGLFNTDGGTLDAFEFTFYGAAPTLDDVYHYTDEVFDALFDEPARFTLSDTGGEDWLNMAAMTENLAIDLASDGSGGGSVVGAGAFLGIAGGTFIENVVTGDGNDTLTGNNLANELHGMRGDDTLDGGLGSDILWGGAGDDFFVFHNGDGADWIGDFNAEVGEADVIELHSTGFLDFSSLSLAFADDGVDTTIIDLGGGDQITLTGLLIGDLVEDNFVFIA